MRKYLGELSQICRSVIVSVVAFAAIPCTAEDIRWYPNQFLVTERKQPLGAPMFAAIEGADSPLVTIKKLSGGALLVTPRRQNSIGGLALQEAHATTSEPYNGDDTFCKDLLASSALYDSCSPNYEVRILGAPNDPSFVSAGLWGLNGDFGVGAPRAWDRSTGSSDVVVAVIDTGIDYTHPDLAANVWTNPFEVPANGIDDDGNGYIDDVHGINAITGSGDPMDDNEHGTHVSGTIGAVGNNGVGVVGINWNVKILGLKFLNSSGAGSLSDAVEAIDYMVTMKQRGINIRVANNSWGGGGFSQPLADAVGRANEAGIIFAAAAGNEANDNDLVPSYPAGYDSANVVSVAAIDKNGNLASFSNYGQSSVSIAAPGVGILSTVPHGGYASFSGTSMATPHVAGAVALLLSREPELTTQSAISRLYESGVQLQSLASVVRTSRTLNAGRLLNNEVADLPAPPPTPEPCHYTMTPIGFAGDAAVESSPILQQVDEGSFHTIQLPWEFTLYRNTIRSVTVSPNGVIYGRTSTAVDFKNTERAPTNSIAALHSDLIASIADAGTGFRYRVDGDTAWFYWKAKHYSARDAGHVHVWAALLRDGRIRVFTKFDDAAVTSAVQSQATIGLSGSDNASTDTFAYNSPSVSSGLGVEFVPQCGPSGGQKSSATVSKIAVVSATKNKSILAGGKVRVTVQGVGTGDVQLYGSVDGFQCTSSKAIRLTDGKVSITTSIPKTVARGFSLSVDAVKKTVKVKKTTIKIRVNAAKAAKACDKLFLGMR